MVRMVTSLWSYRRLSRQGSPSMLSSTCICTPAVPTMSPSHAHGQKCLGRSVILKLYIFPVQTGLSGRAPHIIIVAGPPTVPGRELNPGPLSFEASQVWTYYIVIHVLIDYTHVSPNCTYNNISIRITVISTYPQRPSQLQTANISIFQIYCQSIWSYFWWTLHAYLSLSSISTSGKIGDNYFSKMWQHQLNCIDVI